MWLTIVVGLAGLVIGFAVGRNPRPFRRAEAVPDGGGQLVAGGREGQDQEDPKRISPGLVVPPAGSGDAERVAERARLVLACASLADRLRDRQPALYGV